MISSALLKRLNALNSSRKMRGSTAARPHARRAIARSWFSNSPDQVIGVALLAASPPRPPRVLHVGDDAAHVAVLDEHADRRARAGRFRARCSCCRRWSELAISWTAGCTRPSGWRPATSRMRASARSLSGQAHRHGEAALALPDVARLAARRERSGSRPAMSSIVQAVAGRARAVDVDPVLRQLAVAGR